MNVIWNIRKALYKVADTLGDVEAYSKGPRAILKREAMRKAHRTLNKATRYIERKLD